MNSAKPFFFNGIQKNETFFHKYTQCIFTQLYKMSSITSNIALNASSPFIGIPFIGIPYIPLTPVSPTTSPPPTPPGKQADAGLEDAGLENAGLEDVGSDSDAYLNSDSEEDLPYHIRWADELARRNRTPLKPEPITRQNTSMVFNGRVIYNGDPEGNSISTYYDDMIFPTFEDDDDECIP